MRSFHVHAAAKYDRDAAVGAEPYLRLEEERVVQEMSHVLAQHARREARQQRDDRLVHNGRVLRLQDVLMDREARAAAAPRQRRLVPSALLAAGLAIAGGGRWVSLSMVNGSVMGQWVEWVN